MFIHAGRTPVSTSFVHTNIVSLTIAICKKKPKLQNTSKLGASNNLNLIAIRCHLLGIRVLFRPFWTITGVS